MQIQKGGTKVRRPNCLSPATHVRLAADVYRYSTSDDDSGCVLDEYSWLPSGLKPDDVHSYFAALPNDKVPFVNSVGDRWRLNQLKYQLPTQDYEPSALLSEAERQELKNFEFARKHECLGRGQIQRLPYDNSRRYCHQCKQPINAEDLVVGAERFGKRAFWHPACFVCVECKELLVELIYYKHEDNVFCGRHHAEQLKPRCNNSECDELIFSSECVEAEGKVFHLSHFNCSACLCQLGGMKYVMRNERPFCVPCYHKAISCNTCGREISSENTHITQNDTHWHEKCYCCSRCGKNLLGKNYRFVRSSLYCSQEECGYRSCKRSSRRMAQTPNGRIRFEFPQPPIQSPPLPPVQLNQTPPENIYETLSEIPPVSKHRSKYHSRAYSDDDFDSGSITSCTSVEGCSATKDAIYTHQIIKMRMKQRKSDLRAKRHQRRSLSMDGYSSKICTTNSPNDELPFDQLSLKHKNKKRPIFVHQNYYSGMPPDFNVRRQCSYASSSTSESDSDDDIYFNLSATITPPQYIDKKQHLKSSKPVNRSYNSKRRNVSMMPTPRIAKKKSNPMCFIS